MDKKIIILIVAVVLVASVFAFFIISSFAEDVDNSKLDILGNGTIEENGTLNVKLSDLDDVALKDKEIHVAVKNSEGNTVFEKSAKTHDNGVANVKMENVSAGIYEVNVTFGGDEEYTASSVVEKLIIGDGVAEEDINNETDNSTDEVDIDSTQDQSSSSYSYNSQSSYYSPSSSSSSSSSSYDDGGAGNYYDENGNEVDPVIDENGNPTFEDEE